MFVPVHVAVCAPVCTCMCTHAHAYGGQRTTLSGMSFFRHLFV